MNDFVDYLNSINNYSGDSTGSLAEKQVKSKYYDLIKIDRRLGKFIADCIRKKDYKVFILTGHAGDGKTSILVQVLKSLGYLFSGDGLSKEKEYADFYYVKDMSEIEEQRRTEVLTKALRARNNGRCSLLISNTGPLLETITALEKSVAENSGQEFSKDDEIWVKTKVLKALDKNDNQEISIAGEKAYVINIARIDNVSFATNILEKYVDEALWAKCEECKCKDKCPILFNRRIVAKQFSRVASFIENYYRFLYENDKRMTIRQIAGQISFAMTGNLSCHEIETKMLKEPFFNYNFANLFFGFCGIEEKKDATQINGIKQIQLLELDKTALDVDYRLFVNNDRSFFLPEIEGVLQGLNKNYHKHYQVINEETRVSNSERKTEIKLRSAVRRFYLVFGERDDSGLENLWNQIYGLSFADYCKLVDKKQPKALLRRLQSTVFQALYVRNTGSVPNGQSELPLTLRREDDVFQNVMLVLGKVNKSDLELVQWPVNGLFEDNEEKQTIGLDLKGRHVRITLPMVNYFQALIAGAIASNNNPALTHGIATLDAILLECFGEKKPESEEDCEMKVLVNTTSGQEYETFSFSDNQLNVW